MCEAVCDCMCIVCRLNADVANLAAASLPADVQTQLKAQVAEVAERRTQVNSLNLERLLVLLL